MSRMIGVLWRGPVGAHATCELAWALRRAAASDPLHKRIMGSGRHCDGFGIFLVYRAERDPPRIILSRSDAYDDVPLEDVACYSNLSGISTTIKGITPLIRMARSGLLLMHARSASEGEPRGTLHAHPFIYTAPGPNGPWMIALAHNGALDKAKISTDLGVQDPAAFSDSYLLTHWVALRLLRGKQIKESLDELRVYTKPGYAMNVIIATLESIRDGGFDVSLHVYSYIPEDVMMDRDKARYYIPAIFRGEGIAGFMSSTVEEESLEIGLDIETKNPPREELLKGFYTTISL